MTQQPQGNSHPMSAQTTQTETYTDAINTHFALAVVAVCLSCLSGFLTIALGLAALIFSLRAQDQLLLDRLAEARRTAWWAGLFGWVTVLISLLPIFLFLFFGGAIVAVLGALASML